MNSKLKCDLRENRRLVEQLATVNLKLSTHIRIFLGARFGTRQLAKRNDENASNKFKLESELAQLKTVEFVKKRNKIGKNI